MKHYHIIAKECVINKLGLLTNYSEDDHDEVRTLEKQQSSKYKLKIVFSIQESKDRKYEDNEEKTAEIRLPQIRILIIVTCTPCSIFTHITFS